MEDLDRRVYPDCIRENGRFFRYLALAGYPQRTQARGLLSPLGNLQGVRVLLRIRRVDARERASLIRGAEQKARSVRGADRAQDRVRGDADLEILEEMFRESPDDLCAVRCAVRLEAPDRKALADLENAAGEELDRVGCIWDGLLCAQPAGEDWFLGTGKVSLGEIPERFMPVLSAASLYPSGGVCLTDPGGLPLGRARPSGGPVLADPGRLGPSVTNGNVLILGNSGEGKSHLLKLLLCHMRLRGRRVLALDAEGEYAPLARLLGGSVVDVLGGTCRLNPFDVRVRPSEGDGEEDGPGDAMRLSRHIAFLKEFFRISRRLDGPDLDALEILIWALYRNLGYTETGKGDRVPVMGDLDALIRRTAREESGLIRPDTLRRLSLSLSPLVRGTQAAVFNGETKLRGSGFTVFDLRGLTGLDADYRSAVLFNVLSYLDHALLEEGNAAASVDELYLFLGIPQALETLRNACKRVRKRNSALLLSTQNPEDFLLPGIREMARPLFSIPSHRFLFHTGARDGDGCRDLLGLCEAQWAAISSPCRGHCLYLRGKDSLEMDVRPFPEVLSLAGLS